VEKLKKTTQNNTLGVGVGGKTDSCVESVMVCSVSLQSLIPITDAHTPKATVLQYTRN